MTKDIAFLYWGPQKLPQIYTVILSVLGRLGDLQYKFAVIYGTTSTYITSYIGIYIQLQDIVNT